MSVMTQADPRRAPLGGMIAAGFAITVAMWGVGYVARLPSLLLPSPLVLVLLLACLLGGGALIGRRTGAGFSAGLLAGAVCGALNLLVLGSFLGGEHPGQVVPSAWWWVPGSLAVCGLLAATGAAAGARSAPAGPTFRNWSGLFTRVAVAATLMLLAVGGLVTSAEAGLAVADWPTSFGYNMFLYPFSRMTGGIYYEHAHRLFGALVGLTTVVMAVFLQRVEPRAWVRRLGWAAVGLVIAQGVLGGLRVTRLSLALAVTHGVAAQVFLSLLVALAAFTSETWRSGAPSVGREGARTDRLLAWSLVSVMIVQLVLGAIQRHFQSLLLVHIVIGVAGVFPLALNVGLRAWALDRERPVLARLGRLLAVGVALQLVLGLGALLATRGAAEGALPYSADLIVATAHQWFGALLLATAVALLCFRYRLVHPAGADATR